MSGDFVGGGFNNTAMPGGGLIQSLRDKLKKSGDDNSAHSQRTESMALSQQHWLERESLKHKNSMEIMTLAPKSRLSSVAMGEHGPSATWRDPTPRTTAAVKKTRAARQKPPQSQPPSGPQQGSLF